MNDEQLAAHIPEILSELPQVRRAMLSRDAGGWLLDVEIGKGRQEVAVVTLLVEMVLMTNAPTVIQRDPDSGILKLTIAALRKLTSITTAIIIVAIGIIALLVPFNHPISTLKCAIRTMIPLGTFRTVRLGKLR